ncbi:MAG: ribosome biogenesis GTPase Der [Pseudomonadota bacterium]
MLPTVALVGRPNVGKSTLFNKLTRSRDALVADVPGLTRDRRYGRCQIGDLTVNLVDTGGLFGDHALADELTAQTRVAVDEADVVVLLLDGREGINTADEDVVDYLRRANIPFVPVINKIDGINEDQVVVEFSAFGFSDMTLISASNNRGLKGLTAKILHQVQQANFDLTAPPAEHEGVAVAVVGRPNVGKSTLINRLLGEERQVVFDMPGTTKDAIDIPFERDGTDYVLIDTAGVRRKGKVSEVTEKFSVVKSLDAMQRADVVIVVVDAKEGIVDQDLHVLQYAQEAGAALLVAINKWDGLSTEQRDRVTYLVERKLKFIPWIPLLKISALHGTGVGHLFNVVDEVYSAGEFEVSTSLLTRLLENMVRAHPPPTVRGRQIKMKLATRAGAHPPRIAIHGNQLEELPASFLRYLENGYREALDLIGNPVKLDLRSANNPFASKRNTLTDRQKRRRQRVIKHRKKR